MDQIKDNPNTIEEVRQNLILLLSIERSVDKKINSFRRLGLNYNSKSNERIKYFKLAHDLNLELMNIRRNIRKHYKKLKGK
jgi:hypothetical protein